MKAFRPDADLTLDAPMTPERVLLDLHREPVTDGSGTDSRDEPVEADYPRV